MNKKTKIMWILNIPVWLCCIASITVLPFSKVAWKILTAVEWVLVLVIIIIFVLNVIELKKKEKELNKQLEETSKQLKDKMESWIQVARKEVNMIENK